MTVNSKCFRIITLNTAEYGLLTFNIKPYLDHLRTRQFLHEYVPKSKIFPILYIFPGI